jgi:CelD/BcsL family acetyltransferase involved in cellulose biosynthesis
VNVEMLEVNPYPETVGREWESLLFGSQFQNPFLTPLWNEIWLKHFGKSLQAQVILFRNGKGPLLGVGAFSNSVEEGERVGLTLLGSMDVCDYRDLVLSPGKEEEVFRALGKFFQEGPWKYLEFNGISQFSPTAKYLPPLFQSLGYQVIQEVEEVGLYLNLPPTWEIFLESLNSKDRHELRRKMRRLEREASFEVSEAKEPLSLIGSMEIFFDLHRKSSKDKAEFMTPKMQDYFRELSARFQERGWLDLSFLKIDGKEVATFFSFEFAGTKYVYNSGYDPQLGWISPGIVLAAHCIRRAIVKRISVFNFLRGREEYKYHLGGREEKIYRIRVAKV